MYASSCTLFSADIQPLHIIVRDDASTDHSFALLQEFGSRITLTRSEKNLGILGNFQELIKQSKAPYVMFSDGDDVWKKEKVAKTFAAMQALEAKHGPYVPLLVHTDLQVVDRHLETIHSSFWRYILSWLQSAGLLYSANWCKTPLRAARSWSTAPSSIWPCPFLKRL